MSFLCGYLLTNVGSVLKECSVGAILFCFLDCVGADSFNVLSYKQSNAMLLFWVMKQISHSEKSSLPFTSSSSDWHHLYLNDVFNSDKC